MQPCALGVVEPAQRDAVTLRWQHDLAIDREVGKRGGLYLVGQRLGFGLEEDAENHLAIVAFELKDQPFAKHRARRHQVRPVDGTPPPSPPVPQSADGSLRIRGVGAGEHGGMCGPCAGSLLEKAMTSLRDLVPEATTLLSMHPGELAGYVLESLNKSGPNQMHRRTFCMTAAEAYRGSASSPPREDIAVACSAAWSWLDANQLICQRPSEDAAWYSITRRGLEVRDHAGVRALIEASQLPESFLHPLLVHDVLPLFRQGRFDTAVFEAFKSLEVAIRDAAGLGPDLVGVALASRAFHVEDGQLTDKNVEKGERVALMSLMTGALGSYKNPQSHRHVGLGVSEAREMIIIASHLLGIVDQRISANNPSQP